MNETLTSGFTDFFDVVVGDIDEEIFSSLIGGCNMFPGDDKAAEFLKVCFRYNAHGWLDYLGYS